MKVTVTYADDEKPQWIINTKEDLCTVECNDGVFCVYEYESNDDDRGDDLKRRTLIPLRAVA